MGSLFPVVQKAIASVEPEEMEEIAKLCTKLQLTCIYTALEELICAC